MERRAKSSSPAYPTRTGRRLRATGEPVQTLAPAPDAGLTSRGHPPTVGLAMGRHRGFILVSLAVFALGVGYWYFNQRWEGWEYILQIVGKGDNMPIAGLIPIITFFTYLALDEAFRHDRLIKQGREDEVLDEMYR
jgi:hypothetical protein